MSRKSKKLIVIGGGISGLSAAYYAQKIAREQGVSLEITLVEKEDTFGGKIRTLRRDGFIIEQGPDSFLARKLPIIHLTNELGLEDQLVGTNPSARKTYILHNDQLHRMPPGLVLGIPTQLGPFMKTGLISPWGKARAVMDLILPRRKEISDESLGDFLQRRLGKEVLERVAEPLLAGIYAGDTHSLSLLATFPQFRAVEQEHRSLIRGMMANRKKTAVVENVPEIARNSVFLTYKNGLQALVDGIIDALDRVDRITGQGVEKIAKQAEDVADNAAYNVCFTNGHTIRADGVILALPTYAAARVLASDLPAMQQLDRIPYVSVANVIMAFTRSELNHSLDGSGFLVPRKAGRYITACTWTSSKWLHAAPEGKVLLRCYVGRSGEEHHLQVSDEELEQRVRQDLQEIMGITAKPLFTEVTRWDHSMPQYPIGHRDQVKRIREELAESMPGILITGSGYHGVGIPDCIQQGKEAAELMSTLFK